MCCSQLEERVAQLNVRLAEVQKDAQVSATTRSQLLHLCRGSQCPTPTVAKLPRTGNAGGLA